MNFSAEQNFDKYVEVRFFKIFKSLQFNSDQRIKRGVFKILSMSHKYTIIKLRLFLN
jgi:hypothetical protein